MPRRKRDPEPRMYMHDVRIGTTIVSTACAGASCEICAVNPEAAKRANNRHFWPQRDEDEVR